MSTVGMNNRVDKGKAILTRIETLIDGFNQLEHNLLQRNVQAITCQNPSNSNYDDVNLAISQLATSAISAETYPGLIGSRDPSGSGLWADPLVILH